MFCAHHVSCVPSLIYTLISLQYTPQGFHKLTGYENEDVVGRNCRFLQGPDTTDDEKNPIREAIKLEQDCNVALTNYKKDGTMFKNEVR